MQWDSLNHGMKVVAACDWSQPFTEAFAEIHPQVPVVHGDISDKAVIKQLHSLHVRPAILMSGFSCQPFSTGGQQLGALDRRSHAAQSCFRAGVCTGRRFECHGPEPTRSVQAGARFSPF